MIINSDAGYNIELTVSDDDLIIINNVINESCEVVSDKEYQSRMGYTRKKARSIQNEVHQLFNKMEEFPRICNHAPLVSGDIKMEGRVLLVNSYNKHSAVLTLKEDDLVFIDKAIKASLDMVDDWEYQTRVGFTKDEVRILQSKIHHLFDEMEKR